MVILSPFTARLINKIQRTGFKKVGPISQFTSGEKKFHSMDGVKCKIFSFILRLMELL